MESSDVSDKLILPAFLFWLILGIVGAHYFYVRRTGTGLLFIILNPLTCGIWWIIDLVFILNGTFKDDERRKLVHWIR